MPAPTPIIESIRTSPNSMKSFNRSESHPCNLRWFKEIFQDGHFNWNLCKKPSTSTPWILVKMNTCTKIRSSIRKETKVSRVNNLSTLFNQLDLLQIYAHSSISLSLSLNISPSIKKNSEMVTGCLRTMKSLYVCISDWKEFLVSYEKYGTLSIYEWSLQKIRCWEENAEAESEPFINKE